MPYKDKNKQLENKRLRYKNKKQSVLEANAKYHKTDKGLFARLVQKAKKRNIEVLISLDEFKAIRTGNCIYCGGSLPEMGYGLDRKNSNLPYSKENLVPCCWNCNRMKGSSLSYEEMIIAMKAIKEFRNSKL